MATKLSIEEILKLCKVVICDIEGTTSSISFVKDTLFPYALKNVESYLCANWDTDTLKPVIGEIRSQSTADLDAKLDGALEIKAEDGEKDVIIKSIVQYVEWMMSNDRKVNALKNLQGLIWENAYKDGAIKGHVYEDVPKAFESWTKSGKKVYIYSSGSVLAQKLLFQHTEFGNLLEHLTDHFDTKVGLKQEADSYKKIVETIAVPADNCLFLTDIVKEGEAAKSAGLNVILLDRPGNAAFSDEDKSNFVIIKTFDDLIATTNGCDSPTTAASKRKIETDGEIIEDEKPTKITKLEESTSDTTDKPESKPEPAVSDEVTTEKTEDVEMKDETEKTEAVSAEAEPAKVETIDEKPSTPKPVEEEPSKIEEKSEVVEEKKESSIEDKSTTKEESVKESVVEQPKVEEPTKSETTEKVEKTDDVKPEEKVEPVVEEVKKPAEIEEKMEVDEEDGAKISTLDAEKSLPETKTPIETKTDEKTDEKIDTETVVVDEKKCEKTDETEKTEDKKVEIENKEIETTPTIDEKKKDEVDVEMTEAKDETDKVAADVVVAEEKPVAAVVEETPKEKIEEKVEKVEEKVDDEIKTNGTIETDETKKESNKTETDDIVLETVTETKDDTPKLEKIDEKTEVIPSSEPEQPKDNGTKVEEKNGNGVEKEEVKEEEKEVKNGDAKVDNEETEKKNGNKEELPVIEEKVQKDTEKTTEEEKVEIKNGNGVAATTDGGEEKEKNGHTDKVEKDDATKDVVPTTEATAATEVEDDIEKIKKIKESLAASATTTPSVAPAVVVEAET